MLRAAAARGGAPPRSARAGAPRLAPGSAVTGRVGALRGRDAWRRGGASPRSARGYRVGELRGLRLGAPPPGARELHAANPSSARHWSTSAISLKINEGANVSFIWHVTLLALYLTSVSF